MAGGPFLFLGGRTADESPVVWVRARPWDDMEIVLWVISLDLTKIGFRNLKTNIRSAKLEAV